MTQDESINSLIEITYSRQCDIGGQQIRAHFKGTRGSGAQVEARFEVVTVTHDIGVVKTVGQTKSVLLPSIEIQRMKKMMKDIQIISCGDDTFGCDGDVHTLTMKYGFFAVELKWWCEIPKAWVNVDKLHNWIMAHLNKENLA
jgi:hypothetical protein